MAQHPARKRNAILRVLVVEKRSALFRYGFATFFSLLMVTGTQYFWSFSEKGAGHTMLPLVAVLISAVVGGMGPGIVATFVTTFPLLVWLPPSDSLAVSEFADRVWLAVFLVIALGTSWLGAVLKNAIRVEERFAHTMEDLVEKRTSELVKANEALKRLVVEIQEQQHFLDSLVDNIPSVIFVKRASDLKFVRINKAGERLMGPSDLYIGKSVFDFMTKKQAEAYMQSDLQIIRSSKPSEREENFMTKLAGERVMYTKKIPIFGQDGRVAYILGISEDITERKELESQMLNLVYEQAARIESDRKKNELEEALRARDTFLSICSHELKNPLTSLKLQSGVVRMLVEKKDAGFLFSDRMRKLMHETDSEIDRILRLIEDMLDVSRIRAGKLSLRPERMDLASLIREIVARFKLDPDFKDRVIEVVSPESVMGIWDRHRMEQIIVNLVSNALKYGDKKPVRIEVSNLGKGRYRIIVADRGVGISREHQEKIFQRFERAGAPEGISGLGLGLYIVREIVNGHGGTIRVESEKGKGSRFIVELPIDSSRMQEAA